MCPYSLFINVYVLVLAALGNNLSMCVWVYGGADVAGSISSFIYNGCYLAHDSILVSINYYVEPLGWLSLESTGLISNYGI